MERYDVSTVEERIGLDQLCSQRLVATFGKQLTLLFGDS